MGWEPLVYRKVARRGQIVIKGGGISAFKISKVAVLRERQLNSTSNINNDSFITY